MSNDYSALYETHLQSLPLVARGKVRDIYAVGSDHLLIVTTDRLSAFDVILPDPVPGKGAILTAVSNFWFARMRHVIPNHLADMTLEDAVPDAAERQLVAGVKIASGSSAACASPGGSRMPQTAPVCW